LSCKFLGIATEALITYVVHFSGSLPEIATQVRIKCSVSLSRFKKKDKIIYSIHCSASFPEITTEGRVVSTVNFCGLQNKIE
jgi:hypothetical protein